jgi:hypothetical protein
MKLTFSSWATPLVISAFIVSGVTGLMLFFHLEAGLVKPFHEWLSWAFVAGAVFHTAAHWKSFKSYFSRKTALAIISTGAIAVLAAIMIPSKGGHGNPFMKISATLASAPLETVAGVVHLTPEAAVEKLGKSGLKVADSNRSVKQIAAENGKKEIVVLQALFE